MKPADRRSRHLLTTSQKSQRSSSHNEWRLASCLKTSLLAAPAMATLVEAPHPGAQSGAETVVVRPPVANGAAARAGARTGGQVGADHSVMTGVPPAGVAGEPSVGVIGGRIVVRTGAGIAALEAGRSGRLVAARC